MALKMIRKHNRFRVEGQEISLDWLADTRANRKAALVFMRLLSTNSPISSQPQWSTVLTDRPLRTIWSCFVPVGGGFIQFLSHKRKVDEKVVSTVLTELKTDPLASGRDLQTRVNGRLGRDNLSVANINVNTSKEIQFSALTIEVCVCETPLLSHRRW